MVNQNELSEILSILDFFIINKIDIEQKIKDPKKFDEKRREDYRKRYMELLVKTKLAKSLETKNIDTFDLNKVKRFVKEELVRLNSVKKEETEKKEEQEVKQETKNNLTNFDFYNVLIPNDIKQSIREDMDDAVKCYNHSLYRASIILCARILEIALHRKYYEITKIDLLEKSPGIGLGNLIAKMSEKNISVPPGVSQQIHLINNVRINNVHVKQDIFKPTKEQTYAILLLTYDVLKRLF